jgi:non-heme chloroperoxidase
MLPLFHLIQRSLVMQRVFESLTRFRHLGKFFKVGPDTSFDTPIIVDATRLGDASGARGMTLASSSTLTAHEIEQIERANASGKQPVMFVHGLWLLPHSWEGWSTVMEDAGYVSLIPGWPDDPETETEANEHPEALADKTIGLVADHFAAVIERLERRPAIVGHSFGGMLAQILAGLGLSVATVAIDPAAFRGVLPLPFSALRSAFPILGNPSNRHRAVPLTYEQFRYAFANALDEDEAERLYKTFAVPAPGAPLFQAAFANLNPWTEAKVDTESFDRGPMLIVSGELDHTVPRVVAKAAFEQQRRNQDLTEFVEMKGRGHSLTIDNGWREVADVALNFIARFT